MLEKPASPSTAKCQIIDIHAAYHRSSGSAAAKERPALRPIKILHNIEPYKIIMKIGMRLENATQ